MSAYSISKIFPSDVASFKKIDQLLEQEGIRRDDNLDYTCAIFDEDLNVIATGSCFGNTLRCLGVRQDYQGEGLLNKIVSHLVNLQFERGNSHIFLYTKPCTAKYFTDLGFYEIVRLPKKISFMENKKSGFQTYLSKLAKNPWTGPRTAALVLNANPFTLGHQYLIEQAAAENDWLHLFIVSEDSSLVPFSIRKQLVQAGTAHLKNIIYHDTGDYIISRSTFPSYFLRDKEQVIESQARIDLTIFIQIAKELDISRRYVGEEPTSLVTSLYNQIMQEDLPKAGIDCITLPRKETAEGQVISASTARQAIKEGNWKLLERLLPQSSLDYFLSEQAKPVIERIQAADEVRHY
ncbi:[citrate [pro-3S]-lyase] ligase [Streptococcus criceti]|uniref:[Citrate [pro-3S]-lyase] ligase n=1 Tax=Streptococcus criceti HS-6 TaxID=873449 RepID=G5JPA1_STRCG|nr:[citrate (pro-3S)-lyase] ligase [Streptococcus criceti]EHI75116.1 [citrate (pro-3S)-lyase] ligase family protein [Streptococcus criceti HS-6]SUN41825.1 [citrate [pro-3S]-lyase] ligase [Streptococcus criceti]